MSWQSREELAHEVVTRKAQGMASRAIARALGVSRNTVKSLLIGHTVARETGHAALAPLPTRAPRAQKVDVFKPRIAELMKRFADITSQRVFEILREEGFDGGYTAIKKHMRVVRPPKKPEPSRTTPIYGPGEMGESDWSPYEVKFTTGKRAIIQALSYVLVNSTRKFFELYESNGLHPLMDGHKLAFERFGGCAEQCKYDSQKPVVLRWEGNQPIYNPRFLAFSSHYEFRPLAVRRGHPNDKPRTERSFWEVERSAGFFKLMSVGVPRAWAQQARQILMLRERYHTSDIDAALGRAASFGAVDFPTVERILAVHAKPRTLDEYVAEEMAQRIEQTLGKARTKPRDLLEYDRLPLAGMVRTPHQETTACPSESPPHDNPAPSPPTMPSLQD
jgi:transposase